MLEADRSLASERFGAVATRLLDLTVDVSCVATFDGKIADLAGRCADLLGYSPEHLTGRSVLGFVHPDDVDATAGVFAALRDGAEVTQFVNRFVAQDGSLRWLQWTAVADRASERFYAVATDLTPGREAEEHLRESETRYLDLIESSHDLVQSILPDGHFEFVNRAWHDALGYTPEELPELTLFDVVDGADHDHCTTLIGQLMHGHNFEQVEVTFVTKGGRRFPAEGNATGRFRDGEFVATHAFFRDVSERRRAEELASQYQRQLEQEVAERTVALVQSEKLATLGRLSAGMAHELNNPAAAAQRGGAQLREVFSETCSAFFQLAHLGLSGEDSRFLADLVGRGADRARVPVSIDPIVRGDLESEIEAWLDDHGIDDGWDLAGPLVGVGLGRDDLDGLATRLRSDQIPLVLGLLSRSHTAFALVEQITHGSQRVSEIVTALKDYSFMDRAPIQSIAVEEGLDNTLVMLQAKLKRGVEVERDYGSEVPRIETRASQLNQVWTNLIDNAVDAMGGAGHLVLRTRPDDGGVIVEIEDDGPGIPPEVVDKVFDPFFTTKKPGEGTGLGLNIVFNIVRDLGGRISVRSKPGCTIFTVRVPARAPEATDEGGES